MLKKQFLIFTVLFVMGVLLVYHAEAQDELTRMQTQLQTTNTTLRGGYLTFRNLVFVVCGILGLVVLPGKLQKMQGGDPDAGKSAVQWGGGLVFVCAAAYVVQLMFFAA